MKFVKHIFIEVDYMKQIFSKLIKIYNINIAYDKMILYSYAH